MRSIYTRFLLAGLACAFMTGCSSGPDPVVVERPDAARQELQRHLAQGSPELAVQRISALRKSDLLTGPELDSYYSRAVSTLEEQLAAALDGAHFGAAIRIARNLDVLGAPAEGVDLNSLYVDLAVQLYEAENLPAALQTLLRAPALSSVDPEILERAAVAARRLNNRVAAGVIAELLGPAWRENRPDYMEFVQSQGSPVDMVAGTATVWVNRGLRLEGGVGIPDRVIGSGFFVDPRGYLVTNYHVISSEVDPEYEGYSRLYVRLPDKPAERVPARVVGYDRIFDIALLKVEIDPPYVFSFADAKNLSPGERIIAIGSPGGLENTVTSGIVSAVGRRFLQMGDAVQVDVPINPGSSGGPLLDTSGNVVALVFAGIEQFEGINFAIPSFWIQKLLPDLYTGGEVVHPWMGVAVFQADQGLKVIYVANDSPADRAGLRVGDVITGIDGWEAGRIGAAQAVLLNREPGSLVAVSWDRDGESVDGIVALGERPFSPVEDALDADLHERLFPVLYGMSVERTGGVPFRKSYQVTEVYPGTVADETGIASGDTFTERDFTVDDELRVAFLQIFIKKRTEGFMQSGIQLPAYIETDVFL